MNTRPTRTVRERFALVRRHWTVPEVRVLGIVQLLTWTVSDLGWQFPEAVRIRYVYWRTGNHWSGPPFPWIRR